MEKLPGAREQLNREDLYRGFIDQLRKDFEQSNFPVDFINKLKPDYQVICDVVAQELQRHPSKSDSALMNLLYRIDISEGQLKKYFSQSQQDGYYKVLAELIIKRVLQKVVLKLYYKNKA